MAVACMGFVCPLAVQAGTQSDVANCEARPISDFLDADKEYEAIIYKDGKDAHWNDNPTSIDIEKMTVNSKMKKTFILAKGGGLAISLKIKK